MKPPLVTEATRRRAVVVREAHVPRRTLRGAKALQLLNTRQEQPVLFPELRVLPLQSENCLLLRGVLLEQQSPLRDRGRQALGWGAYFKISTSEFCKVRS